LTGSYLFLLFEVRPWALAFKRFKTHRRKKLESLAAGRKKNQKRKFCRSVEVILPRFRGVVILRLVIKAAPTKLPVLIIRDTGTGKELVARRLYSASTRRKKPLITINYAALAETILDIELFGHVKGAFTGADRDHSGSFEEADGGTIFLDEVADMSLVCQAKLLRALDYGEITPVGSNETRKVDVRVISATNRKLDKWVSVIGE
jgi:transcriptional regulator with GAF, ATPase, and Fis domain